MGIGAWLPRGLVFAALVACSGPAPKAPVDQLTGATVLQRRCLGCHAEANGPRPKLSGQLDRAMARKALGAVIRGDMPPLTATQVAPSDREVLIDWLCQGTGGGPSACRDLAARQTERHWIRTGTAQVQAITRIARRPQPYDAASDLLEYSRPSATSLSLSTTSVLLSLMLARDACNESKPQATAASKPAAEQAPESAKPAKPALEHSADPCWRRVLELSVEKLPPPHP